MRITNRQAALTAALMVLVAVCVLFVLPPAVNASEKAFRLVAAIAALLAAALRWRRATRTQGDADRHDDERPGL